MAKSAKKIPEKVLNQAISLIDPWLAYLRYALEFPSLTVGVVNNRKTVFARAYGYADIKKQRKATTQTCYRIASNSKVFTAICIMQLVNKKKLALNDPISKHLPWFKSDKQRALQKVTIRDLLSHSSGLIREGYTHQWDNDQFATKQEIKRFVKKGLLSKSRKGRFKYSNLGFAVLGLLIEQVSGQSYANFTRKTIINPLGFQFTDAQLTKNIREHLATGYGRLIPGRPREVFKHVETNGMEAATGFSSNIVELCRFVIAENIGGKGLLPDEIKQKMFNAKVSINEQDDYGLGYSIRHSGSKKLVGHGGGFPGHTTQTLFDPKEKIGLVLLINTTAAPVKWIAEETFKVFDYYIKHQKEFAKVDLSLSRYEGLYRARWGDMQVVAAGKKLLAFDPRLSPFADFSELISIGKHKFMIQSKDGFDSIGEVAEFIMKGQSSAMGVNWGSHPYKKIRLSK